jgi:D-alanyl-D-alanine carboxypeptidase
MPEHANSPGGQTYAEEATALMESYVRKDLFSGAVLVAVAGRPAFKMSFGLANREWDLPNTPDTKFRIGSVTKTFTAVALLQLAERAMLKLSDPIGSFFSPAPVAWQKITMQHLLTHMSGIPSYTGLTDFAAKLSKIDRSPAEIIELTQNEPLRFEPGTQFAYSNSGYILLGYVIEKVTGLSYRTYLQENLFGPLLMCNTGYDDSTTILPRRASGYQCSSGRLENASYVAMSLPFAAGSLYSTIDDLLIWDQALSNGKVLNAESLRAMFTDYGHGYGFGWIVDREFDRPLQAHNGAINGFRSTLDRYPEDKLTVIILSNLETSPVEKLARELAALGLGVTRPVNLI